MAPQKFSEKVPFTEWWTTVVRYLWRFNGVNFDTPLVYVLRESEIPVEFGAAELSGCTPLEEKYYTTLSPAATMCVTIAVSRRS